MVRPIWFGIRSRGTTRWAPRLGRIVIELLRLLVVALGADYDLGATPGLAEDGNDRKIAASDIIIVEVFGEKDLSGEHRVQQSGTIKYPLLGSVDVSGKTPGEVATLITQRLEADFLVDPQVNVMVKEYRMRTVSGFYDVRAAGDDCAARAGSREPRREPAKRPVAGGGSSDRHGSRSPKSDAGSRGRGRTTSPPAW